MEHFRPSDDCRRFYGSLSPQEVPYLAATLANLLAERLPPSQMLLLGNFLSLLTSSLFAMANLQVIDDHRERVRQGRREGKPVTSLSPEEFGPVD